MLLPPCAMVETLPLTQYYLRLQVQGSRNWDLAARQQTGYTGIMENKMETTIQDLGFRVPRTCAGISLGGIGYGYTHHHTGKVVNTPFGSPVLSGLPRCPLTPQKIKLSFQNAFAF